MSKIEKRELRKLMTNYRYNKAFISNLNAWGLEPMKTKKHIKIVRRDGVGGMVFIAANPSDYRAGMNAAVEIIRLLEAV